MKRIAPFLIVMIAAALLASCGGGSASTTIDVSFTDFHFVPDSFVIPAGQEITVNASNDGAVVHEFAIMKLGATVGDDFGAEDQENIYWKVEVLPGGNATETFTAPTEAGEYQIVCGTPGHYLAGMVGKLTVIAP